MGTAAALYHTVRSESSAFARLNADGDRRRLRCRQRHRTRHLHLDDPARRRRPRAPDEQGSLLLGDSRFPKAATQYGSQGMASIGSSIALTADMLRDRAIRTAIIDPSSPLNGLRPEDVDVVGGRMPYRTEPGRGETYQELLRRRGLPSLDPLKPGCPRT